MVDKEAKEEIDRVLSDLESRNYNFMENFMNRLLFKDYKSCYGHDQKTKIMDMFWKKEHVPLPLINALRKEIGLPTLIQAQWGLREDGVVDKDGNHIEPEEKKSEFENSIGSMIKKMVVVDSKQKYNAIREAKSIGYKYIMFVPMTGEMCCKPGENLVNIGYIIMRAKHIDEFAGKSGEMYCLDDIVVI